MCFCCISFYPPIKRYQRTYVNFFSLLRLKSITTQGRKIVKLVIRVPLRECFDLTSVEALVKRNAFPGAVMRTTIPFIIRQP